MSDHEGIRLQKVLAQAGVASRRAAEQMVAEGRIEVNGELVLEQGRRVDPRRDVIRVDGARIPPPREHAYLVFNKPRGVVSTMSDPQGRPTLSDYLGAHSRQGLFHVGRLDTDTDGMILLTNDGDFAQRMMHPSYEVPKTYIARVEGQVTRGLGRVLTDGITLEDGPIKVDKFVLREAAQRNSIVEITLHSGRNRIVRRIMDEVGHPVMELVRTKFGTIEVGRLKPGRTRVIAGNELSALMHSVGM